jgi:DNA-binding transcriptional ArsR family regulator
MLAYLVSSRSRRRLLELLWQHDASGSVSELAKRARVAFASAYRELKLMEDFGLVTVRVESGREVYAAANDHRDAALLRSLVAARPSSAAPDDDAASTVRRRVRSLGAPLPVPPAPVLPEEREQVLVEAVRLARRDATLARVLPVVLAAQFDKLDRNRLEAAAVRAHEKHALGFFLALTAELQGNSAMREWAAGFRDHRVKGPRPFFALPSARSARNLAVRRTPQVAREWGYLMDLDLDAFRSAFDKHVA